MYNDIRTWTTMKIVQKTLLDSVQVCTFIAKIAINAFIELNISYKVSVNYTLNTQSVVILSKT